MTRGLVALALLAALLGAPRPVSAAVNELTGARVSPASGSVTTVFVMRVNYDGGFPATAVTVTAGGVPRPMALEAGTLSSGTWVLATPLPPGTWPLTFAATVLRGPSPTLVGPTVSVAGVPAPAPTPTPNNQATPPRSSGSMPSPGDDPTSVDEPDEAPASSSDAEPAPNAPGSEAQASPDDDRGPSDPGTAPATAAPGTVENDPDDGSAGDGAPTTDPPKSAATGGSGGGADGPDPADHGSAPAADRGGDPAADPSGSPVEPDGLLAMVLIIGLIGVAAVALIGTLLLAAGRRRQDEEEPAAAPVGVAPEGTAADELLTRRALRRARMRVADDPILSALGVDEQMQARRDRRAGQEPPDQRRTGDG
jgi:hypothetical protein